MYTIMERYIKNLNTEKINSFALNNNIVLTEDELNYIYSFIQKNYSSILANHGVFDISLCKSHLSEENYKKIVILYKESLKKYSNYL